MLAAAPRGDMHASRRLQTGVRGRLGGARRLGVSPLLRHSPVRAPPPGEDGAGAGALELSLAGGGPHEVYLGNWPEQLHELEIAALFHKYSIYPKHIHLHRKHMFESYAFVELACAEDVARAIDQLHGGKVLGHQIVVCRSRGSRRPRPELDGGEGDQYECESTEFKSPPSSPPPRKRCSSIPPLVLPLPEQEVRRQFSDRDEDLYGAPLRPKRVCTREGGWRADRPDGSVDSAPHDQTPDSSSGGPQSARSSATNTSASAADSDMIRHRLHQPVDVLVANFPANSADLELMDLFGRYKPLRVRIMVNDPGMEPGAFTYAYVTVWNTMVADSAVLELDGRLYRGRHLVVEVRRS
ncbi:hypothetical protein FJT64_021474 [Amphibalanus amphitrite]|uniref:RRM domain-containing protein n=1 Tax=Amphibalanus amphitrite TaxID=1232801 RepID=A0A6A4WTG4_AMPAM|nr:hypothetical protein FJT64_021474 [Amphibalanus amphitrite]